jgi:hypothetical protein
MVAAEAELMPAAVINSGRFIFSTEISIRN